MCCSSCKAKRRRQVVGKGDLGYMALLKIPVVSSVVNLQNTVASAGTEERRTKSGDGAGRAQDMTVTHWPLEKE